MVRFAWKQLKFRVIAAEHGGDVTAAKAPRWRSSRAGGSRSWSGCREEIFDELMADRIWSGTHALARLHLDAGQRVWLVTAAPVELGRIIAQRLGLTGALGTVAEIRDGEYTGRLVGDMLHGPAKAEAIDALAAAEGLDLDRCSAYSDSVNDTPMLSLVGHAVAVNPDSRAAPRGPRARLGDARLPHRPQGGEGGGAGRAGHRHPGRRRRGRALVAPAAP